MEQELGVLERSAPLVDLGEVLLDLDRAVAALEDREPEGLGVESPKPPNV